jgi:hypothetical protein
MSLVAREITYHNQIDAYILQKWDQSFTIDREMSPGVKAKDLFVINAPNLFQSKRKLVREQCIPFQDILLSLQLVSRVNFM